MKRKFSFLISMALVLSMVLAACGKPAPVEPTDAPVVETEAPVDTPAEPEVDEPVEEPEEEPVVRTERRGGWLDEIVYTVADPAAVLPQIQAGDIDIYAEGLAPEFAQEVRDSG